MPDQTNNEFLLYMAEWLADEGGCTPHEKPPCCEDCACWRETLETWGDATSHAAQLAAHPCEANAVASHGQGVGERQGGAGDGRREGEPG